MPSTSLSLSGPARWCVLAALVVPALMGCSSDSSDPVGTAGAAPGGAGSGGAASGGAGSSAGGAATGGMATAGMPSGGANSGGAGANSGGGGASAGGSGGGSGGGGSGGGGSGGGGSGGGGSGGGGSGGGGGAGGGGAGGGQPTAVAMITGLNGQTVTGTATFTQGATMTKLVLDLTACPAGKHSSHLHMTKDCGNNGTAAGGHWVPNGENLGDYTCADNKVTHTVEKPTSQWTVGDGATTDVSKYSFMVHAQGDDQGSGDRIGCGVINKQ